MEIFTYCGKEAPDGQILLQFETIIVGNDCVV
jgi:hypothetical protein